MVDDEATFAAVVCEALAEGGHHVEMASDGHAALARIEQQEFDLIISDLRMPGMGGERLHRALETDYPHLAGRLLLTTGDTVGEEVESLAARTGLEILHKPFELDELRSRVRARLDPHES